MIAAREIADGELALGGRRLPPLGRRLDFADLEVEQRIGKALHGLRELVGSRGIGELARNLGRGRWRLRQGWRRKRRSNASQQKERPHFSASDSWLTSLALDSKRENPRRLSSTVLA